jgi:hypothetical protein
MDHRDRLPCRFRYLIKFCGIVVWAVVFGTVIRDMTQHDPDAAAYSRDVDSLNRLITYHQLPTDMAREFRRFLEESKELNRAKSRAEFYTSKLSPILAQKASSFINRNLLGSDLFQFAKVRADEIYKDGGAGCRQFVAEMMTLMKPTIYAPRDKPPQDGMYLITSGSCWHRGESLGPGECWGIMDVTMRNPKKYRSIAATYLHVQVIKRDDFMVLEESFPEIWAALKRWALWTAMKHWLVEEYRKDQADRIKEAVAKEPATGKRLLIWGDSPRPRAASPAKLAHTPSHDLQSLHRSIADVQSVMEQVLQQQAQMMRKMNSNQPVPSAQRKGELEA